MLLIPSLKYKTKRQRIEKIKAPELLYLPLDGYNNTMEPVVQIGEKVKKYQLAARSDGYWTSCIHAPVSGEVIKIETIDGSRYLVLKNDFQEEAVPARSFDLNTLSNEDLLAVIRESGIEGSGGAMFPAHLKYDVKGETLHTFIVNGVECEPYLSADYALMSQQTDDLLKALVVVQRLMNVRQIVFGIERQNKEVKTLIEQKANVIGLPVWVKILPDEYPQGGELQLIKSVTGKEIPKGSIPAKYGIIVSNVGTLWGLYQAFYEGRPYTERVVTVSGNKQVRTGNYLVRIGTTAGHILQVTNNRWDTGKQTVIFGGAMMGKAIHSPITPVSKGTGGLLILDNKKSKKNNCIECGYCVDVCPQRLMPLEFVRHSHELQQLTDYHLQDCIECGACAYICPSDVPLMESILNGKKEMRK